MILMLLIFIVFPLSLYAQNGDEVIKKLQDKFATIENLKADFSQTINSTQSQKSIHFEGEFYYKKENSFSILLPKRSIISDGESIWNFDKTQNKVVISTFDNNNITFSLNEIIYSYPEKCSLSLKSSEENSFIIKAVPNDLDVSFKEAYLTINSNFLLTKIEIIDFNNIKYTFQLFSTEINQKIDDIIFKYLPTDEVEVIDLR
ncbi:MAG: outer membrane lipoprotein carrier protein LolA [Melioribacteraceae bacterium]|jgi:outer membrane lipoprotein-sorting protein|nr:outer membrane lipoprotein carrier protein LolA [Melioribacteraceae bacterium]